MSERIFPAASYGFASVCKSENIPPTKRNSPARAPGQTAFAIQDAKIGGLCRGRSRRGRPPRDRPLLKRRGPPRSSPTVGILSGGAIQGLLQWFESSQAGERGTGRENFARFCGESCKFRLTSRRFCGIIIRRPAERGDPAEALSVKFCEDGGVRIFTGRVLRDGRGGFSPAASCGTAGEDFHRPRLAGRRGEDSAGRVLRGSGGGFPPVAGRPGMLFSGRVWRGGGVRIPPVASCGAAG